MFVVYSEPIDICVAVTSIFLSISLSNQSYESFNRRHGNIYFYWNYSEDCNIEMFYNPASSVLLLSYWVIEKNMFWIANMQPDRFAFLILKQYLKLEELRGHKVVPPILLLLSSLQWGKKTTLINHTFFLTHSACLLRETNYILGIKSWQLYKIIQLLANIFANILNNWSITFR